MDGPTNLMVADAGINALVTDTRGREIAVRFPAAFLRMRLARYVGSELQQNQEWWGNAILALSVTMIGELPIIDPRNAEQVEAIIYKLDDDGMIAVANWLKAESERRAENLEASAKNSPSTLN